MTEDYRVVTPLEPKSTALVPVKPLYVPPQDYGPFRGLVIGATLGGMCWLGIGYVILLVI